LNFDGIPPLSPNCLSLSSLFCIFIFHPSTNQARPCLASETRRDWACLGWCFLDWSFSFFHCEDLLFPGFCLFGWFWSHVVVVVVGGWGNNEQIRWESLPTRPFWPNLSNKEA
jgi:hypothetical protein